jgi:hypothetical protein
MHQGCRRTLCTTFQYLCPEKHVSKIDRFECNGGSILVKTRCVYKTQIPLYDVNFKGGHNCQIESSKLKREKFKNFSPGTNTLDIKTLWLTYDSPYRYSETDIKGMLGFSKTLSM